MKVIEDSRVLCEKCINSKKYFYGPTGYEKRVAEWAFELNGLGGACHDVHEFAACALKKRLPASGECAWFEEK